MALLHVVTRMTARLESAGLNDALSAAHREVSGLIRAVVWYWPPAKRARISLGCRQLARSCLSSLRKTQLGGSWTGI